MNATTQMYLSDAITCLRQAIDNDDATYIGFAKYKIEEAEREARAARRYHLERAEPGCPCRDCMVVRSQSDANGEVNYGN
jgi:hypothetical protein